MMGVFNIWRNLSNNTKGLVCYLIAMFVTVVLNIFVKCAIVKFNLPTTEVLCCRQTIIVFFLLPLMIKRKFNFFDKEAFKPNVFRNVIFSLGTFALYIGMSKVPLNDATAITFLTPIIGSILAVRLLGERASKSIWIALVLSIIGVFIIKKPGFNDEDILLGYGALLLAVLARGYVVVLNKRLASKFDTMTMLFYTHTVMLFMSLLSAGQFVKIPFDAIKYIFGASVLFFIEYFLIFKAYKYCSAITLQPFDFSRLLFMMIMSDLLLNEKVTGNQVLGGLVILSGYAIIIAYKKISAKTKK